MIFIGDLITYSYSSHIIKKWNVFCYGQSHIEENENNLISEFLDSIDDEVQENNLISEFLESIDIDNTDNTDNNPEEELINALTNIINTSFNNYDNNNNNNISRPTPIRFIPFINIIQPVSEEDFEMQQAIQRSIEER